MPKSDKIKPNKNNRYCKVESNLPYGVYKARLTNIDFNGGKNELSIKFETDNGFITRLSPISNCNNSKHCDLVRSLVAPTYLSNDLISCGNQCKELLKGVIGRFYAVSYTRNQAQVFNGIMSVVPMPVEVMGA